MSFFGTISGLLGGAQQNKPKSQKQETKTQQKTQPPVQNKRQQGSKRPQGEFGRGGRSQETRQEQSNQQNQPNQSNQPRQHQQHQAQAQQAQHVDVLIREAQAKAREIILESKNESILIREKAETELRKHRQELSDKERILDQNLSSLDSRLKTLDERDEQLIRSREELEKSRQALASETKALEDKLEKLAGLSKEDAKTLLMEELERSLTKEMAQRIKSAENRAKEEADTKAREILVDAMRHGATEYVPEYTVSVVKIPDDETKGRIIGKDGRNIRAFEMVTGVDIELDDVGSVRLSSFDSVRREIAKVSLERLIKDGRIHPANIEKMVKIVKSEIEKIMYEEGKKLCHEVGAYDLPEEIMRTLGRFKYRFSYGQNLILHTLEETKIGIAIARELGANVEIVKLGCLLHDIGKALPDEEGNHIEIGVKYLRKFQIDQAIIDTVEQHHEDVPFSSVEAMIVYIADAISGSRPGARYENYGEYVQRLQKLEEIAMSYEPVKEAYAIQAGREIRVLLAPEKSKDADVQVLAQQIKDRVQSEMTYPGTVTVTVIRELRGADIAK